MASGNRVLCAAAHRRQTSFSHIMHNHMVMLAAIGFRGASGQWYVRGIRVAGRQTGSIVCPVVITFMQEEYTVQNKEIKFRVIIVAASLLLAHQACAMDSASVVSG